MIVGIMMASDSPVGIMMANHQQWLMVVYRHDWLLNVVNDRSLGCYSMVDKAVRVALVDLKTSLLGHQPEEVTGCHRRRLVPGSLCLCRLEYVS